MASITITVPDRLVPRIRAALGRTDLSGVRVPATVAELQDRLLSYIRAQVLEYEARQQDETTRATLSTEDWSN